MSKPLDKEVARDRRIVAGWLLWYEERKQQYEEMREEMLHSSPPPLSEVVPVQGGISDTTGQKGTQLGDLQEAERWLALAEEVEQRIPWKMQILLELKRKYKVGVKGRPVRWLIAVELSKEVSRRLNKDWCVGVDSVDKWWQRIVGYGTILAAKKGLVK